MSIPLSPILVSYVLQSPLNRSLRVGLLQRRRFAVRDLLRKCLKTKTWKKLTNIFEINSPFKDVRSGSWITVDHRIVATSHLSTFKFSFAVSSFLNYCNLFSNAFTRKLKHCEINEHILFPVEKAKLFLFFFQSEGKLTMKASRFVCMVFRLLLVFRFILLIGCHLQGSKGKQRHRVS